MINRQQRYFAISGLLATSTGFMVKAFFRPYVLDNNVGDFGFSNVAPSFFYVAGFSLLLLIRAYSSYTLIICLVTLASIGYEILQYRHHHIVDFGDMAASLAGGILALIVVKMINIKTIHST